MKIDSRELSDLRADVQVNVRLFITLMALQGFTVGVSSTYRNDEQQAYLYASGRTRAGQVVTGSAVTTFHGARLAFDIFQNTPIKAKQYNDPQFWAAADEILSKMGFSRLSSEKCHAQWSDGGKFSGSQVRSGSLPRQMPAYGDKTAEYKATIQAKCNFGDANGVWAYMDKHPFPSALYQKWAESYK